MHNFVPPPDPAWGDFCSLPNPDEDGLPCGWPESDHLKDMWYVNEDGGVYSYEGDQVAEFPNDFHEAFATEVEAHAFADSLPDPNEPWDYDPSEDMYLSGTGELAYDDSYIDYLNNQSGRW